MKYRHIQKAGFWSTEAYFALNNGKILWQTPEDTSVAMDLSGDLNILWVIEKSGKLKIKDGKLFRFVDHYLECRELQNGSLIWEKNIFPHRGGFFTDNYCIYNDGNEWVFIDYNSSEAYRVPMNAEHEQEFIHNDLIIGTKRIIDEHNDYYPFLKFFTIKGEARGVVEPYKLANFKIGNLTLPEKVGVKLGWGYSSTLKIHGNLATFALGQNWATALCCANIDTGEFVWFAEYPIASYQVLNDDLYFIYEELLIVLDLYTGIVKRKAVIQYHPDMDFTMIGWGVTFFTIKDGYLYLTHRGRRAIMIINIETARVEWFDVFREGSTTYMGGYSVSPRPLVLGNRIFAGDSDKVLHVWERVE